MSEESRTFEYPGLDERQREQFMRLAGLIQEENRVHNLTRISETGQIYIRHFADSLAGGPVLREHEVQVRANYPDCRFVDIGSGAGLPALAIAIAFPDWYVTSVEATGKKAAFQQRAAAELDLANLTVRNERAEAMGRDEDVRESYDVAGARALAALPIVLELTAGLVKLGGRILAWKGPDVEGELAAAGRAAKLLRVEHERTVSYRLSELAAAVGLPCPDGEDPQFHLLVFRKTSLCPDRYPRDYSQIRRSPLGS